MQEDKSLARYFGDLPDPRVLGRCEHKLLDIIVIAICAVLCGAEGWEDIEEFGLSEAGWLRQFLELIEKTVQIRTTDRIRWLKQTSKLYEFDLIAQLAVGYPRMTRSDEYLACWRQASFRSVLQLGWKRSLA